MWANNPEMAKKWEKEESLTKESGILYKAGVKKYGKEGMKKIQQAAGKRKSHAEIGKIKDKYEKGKKESVSVNEMPNFDRGTSGLPRGFIDDYNKIVKKLSKGKGFGTLSRSDKKKVWATLGKKYNESVNEAVEPQGNMAKIAKVVKDKQATKLSGVMIDMQSANLLMKLWDAVSDKDKEKMNKMNAKLLTSIIKKLWSRINLKLPI